MQRYETPGKRGHLWKYNSQAIGGRGVKQYYIVKGFKMCTFFRLAFEKITFTLLVRVRAFSQHGKLLGPNEVPEECPAKHK